MGFFDRLGQVWKGFLSLWISDIENRNPEAVYESAIDERIRKHGELKKAVSGIVYLRNKLSTELEEKERELKEVLTQLKEQGRVTRGWIGVSIQELTPELARSFTTSGRKPGLKV